MKQWLNAISADRKKGYWIEKTLILRPSFESFSLKIVSF